ncbi:helix-turn-helix transcriptional regulator [Kineosporia babensis]|uniref:LuxR C-terminal-related transcriptional regulator n=1 Tax=Kineosporia babensis TaxID=499548 RepID=A0A9X1NLA1_9ACTN|nr:LuxR C-terminal-related transcriptional regulator [Kineosporia babensis]
MYLVSCRVALAVPDPLTKAGVEGIIAASRRVRVVPDSRSIDAHLLLLVVPGPGAEAEEAVRAVIGPRRMPILAVLDHPGDSDGADLAELGVVACLWRADLTPERLVDEIVAAAATTPARLTEDLRTYRERRRIAPSRRETDVLRLLAEGLAVPEIAQRLAYSERTVQKTLYTVTARLELRNRTHAVAYAWREGVL